MKIGIKDIKAALKDARFREILPEELQKDVNQYLHNPGCACNHPLYRKILSSCKEQLLQYFPGREIVDEAIELEKLVQNHWTVINCHISELESKLKKLPPGRKQLDVARYEDQCTVVVNELDLAF